MLRRIYPDGNYPTEEEVSTPDLWDRFCAAAVQRKKDAGAPRPWTNDPILDEGKFCHIERERDRTTVCIRENWREPHADNPDLWFAMSLARKSITGPRWPKSGFRYRGTPSSCSPYAGARGARQILL